MTGTPCEDWIIMSTYAVGIVGAGRVGAVLGAALARAGHRIVAASGVSAASKDRIVKLLPGVPALPADEVAAAAELLIIAVPDDTLAPLVAGLADTQALRPGQIVAHTSGAHGIGVLAPAVKAGSWPTWAARARKPAAWPRTPLRSVPWRPMWSGSPRSAGRSTTRRSPTAPTTW